MRMKCKLPTILAYGVATDPSPRSSFKVEAGSMALKKATAKKCRYLEVHQKLVASGVLIPSHNPDFYVFSRDYEFNSISEATGVLKGGANMSGPQNWAPA